MDEGPLDAVKKTHGDIVFQETERSFDTPAEAIKFLQSGDRKGIRKVGNKILKGIVSQFQFDQAEAEGILRVQIMRINKIKGSFAAHKLIESGIFSEKTDTSCNNKTDGDIKLVTVRKFEEFEGRFFV